MTPATAPAAPQAANHRDHRRDRLPLPHPRFTAECWFDPHTTSGDEAHEHEFEPGDHNAPVAHSATNTMRQPDVRCEVRNPSNVLDTWWAAAA